MNTVQAALDLRNISCSGSFLEDFVEQFPDAACVRDAHTGKHLLANRHIAAWEGLKPEDLIGITLHELLIEDITHRREHFNLSNAVISNAKDNLETIYKFEDQLLLTKNLTTYNSTYINFNGLISFENSTKFPILGHSNQIVAFLTIFNDLTHELSLDQLFQLYGEKYPKKAGIQKFLEHFEIARYFNKQDLPTCKEMQILFSMRNDSRHKSVAKKFNYAVSTVHNHIHNIQSKLLNPEQLHDILMKLRSMPAECGHALNTDGDFQ